MLVAGRKLGLARSASAVYGKSRASKRVFIDEHARSKAHTRHRHCPVSRDLSIIRAPVDGKIIRRYANPGAGASTLDVSVMFDLAPAARHIIRAEIVESAIREVRNRPRGARPDRPARAGQVHETWREAGAGARGGQSAGEHVIDRPDSKELGYRFF